MAFVAFLYKFILLLVSNLTPIHILSPISTPRMREAGYALLSSKKLI